MYLLALSALVALANANPALLGSNKCTYGPTYWCSHVKHAKECGAMEHCMTAVWKYNVVPVKDEPKCEMCIFAVTEARKLIKDKATQEQITEFLTKACTLIPDKSLKSECENLVKDYLPEILQLLSSDIDPKVVCTVLKMCNSQLAEVKNTVPKSDQPDLCADCKKFMADLETLMKDNQTVAQIEAALDQLCAQLGPLENSCKQLIAQYLPILLDMLSSEFSPDVFCRMIGLCQSGNVKEAVEFRLKFLELVKQIPMTNDVHGPAECSICKEVMGQIQKLDRDAKTQQEIENVLEKSLCPMFGTLESQCKQLIQEYAPMLFEYLANELDPEVACKAFHMCTAAEMLKKPSTALSVPAKPVFTPVNVKKPVKKARASAGCVICEFVLKELDDVLMQNSSRAEVTRALEVICSKLPATISAECKDFVDQYAPAVIELLVSDLDPAEVCKFIGLCSGLNQALPRVNTGTCDVCKLIVQYVDTLLKENATVEEIIDLLEKICNFLPDTLKNECDSIVQQYGAAIAQLIAQLADPLKVCTEIGLCTNSTATNLVNKYQKHMQKMADNNNTLYFKNSALPADIDKICLTGPKQWCINEETAKQCGIHAVDYCRKHVWVN